MGNAPHNKPGHKPGRAVAMAMAGGRAELHDMDGTAIMEEILGSE